MDQGEVITNLLKLYWWLQDTINSELPKALGKQEDKELMSTCNKHRELRDKTEIEITNLLKAPRSLWSSQTIDGFKFCDIGKLYHGQDPTKTK